MIHETTSIEDDLVDLLGKSALGDEFANLDGGGHIGARRSILCEGFLRGIDAGQCIAGKIVDDLCSDMLAGEMNCKAWPLGGAGDFLAEAYVTQFAGICCGHGMMILGLLDSLAFLAANNLVGVADTLALVGLRRVIGANIGGHLTDEMLVDSLDGDLGIVGDGNLDLLGNG